MELVFPYRGVRRSFFVYHPAHHGPSNKDGQWDATATRFRRLLEDFCAVTQVYGEQQTQSETVGGPHWKKEVLSLFDAISREKDTGDAARVYQLEALAEQIFDTDDKTSQRVLPYHKELLPRAQAMRMEDSGLSIDNLPVPKNQIARRGWTGS